METILFEEIQYFRQKWLRVLLVLSLLFPVVILVLLFTSDTKGTQEAILPLIVSVLSPLAFLLYFHYVKLIVRITPEGIAYRFSPFRRKLRFTAFSEVSKMYVRKYEAFSEFGGWGLRYGLGSGKGYIVSGKYGLQLELKNGKKILFSTQKPEEMERVIQSVHISPLSQ